MRTTVTHSENETKELAKKIAQKIKHGVIALTGELGAGKTTFVQGFAKGVGIKDRIISPTFVLIREHKIPNSKKILYHVDLYRLESKVIAKDLGLKDFWSYPKNLVLIEWAEKIGKDLPEKTTYVKFEKKNEKERLITIS